MPRQRQRACLQAGLRLSLPDLARQGIIRFGLGCTSVRIGWVNNYTGEEIASALIATEMSDGQGSPGAGSFACRERWGRQVAYAAQFSDRLSRAHQGKAKINARLCRIGGYDPNEWDLPPKPKWMRWRTYNRAEAKFDRYEAILDQGLLRVAMRLGFRP